MDVAFDPVKDAENVRKHGISLARASDFEIGSAFTVIDDRKDYGEVRLLSIGYIGDEIHVLIFTMRGVRVRAISLRSANRKECKRYAENAKVRDAG